MEPTTIERTSEMVPARGPLRWQPPLPERPRRNLWRWWWTLPIALFGVIVALATLVELPYYSLSPGLAREINDLIIVSDGGPAYPPDGEVLLTTVSLRQATLVDAFQGWLDDDVEVVAEEVLFPPTVSDVRQFNLALMNDSKQTALMVAFRQLGYEVTEHGQGALVVMTQEGTPAAGVIGIGEAIVQIDGQPVDVSSRAVEIIGSHQPGDQVIVRLLDPVNDTTRDVAIRLAARDDGGPLLGVQLQTYLQTFDFPFEVDIDSGSIGGPSAGLAFTLAVIDHLTQGELTGGLRVAVTGTIAADGTVGAVGGVPQKVAAVRRSGASVFLVPSSEYEAAVARAGGDLRIAGVDDLDDALRVLAELGGNALELPQMAPPS